MLNSRFYAKKIVFLVFSLVWKDGSVNAGVGWLRVGRPKYVLSSCLYGKPAAEPANTGQEISWAASCDMDWESDRDVTHQELERSALRRVENRTWPKVHRRNNLNLRFSESIQSQANKNRWIFLAISWHGCQPWHRFTDLSQKDNACGLQPNTSYV